MGLVCFPNSLTLIGVLRLSLFVFLMHLLLHEVRKLPLTRLVCLWFSGFSALDETLYVLYEGCVLNRWSNGVCLLQRLLPLMMRAATHELDEDPGTSHQDDRPFTLISNNELNLQC